ncbi:MAG: membrane protein YczE [Microbacteriaceae bacterium]
MSHSLLMSRRWTQLLVGLFLYGIAIAMMIRAGIGIAPWDVLSQGIALRTGIPFGLVTNLVGGIVLLLWIPIRQRLGVGTVLNALLIGPSAQVGLWLIPQAHDLWVQLGLFAAGLTVVAIATGLYIGARFGPGPRDGLMTGIHHKYGVRIWVVRSSIEITVLGIGWLLGGNVGLGTLAFALLIGPMVHILMPRLRVPELRRSAPAVIAD